ncbi:hypothetical protein ACFL3R_01750, partial [Thermodesulfobacteriota bacterium]
MIAPEYEVFWRSARYKECKDILEPQIKDMDKGPFYKHVMLCDSYAKLKEYNKLFPCLDALQERMDRGDNTMVLSWDWGINATLLRAEAYLELGQYNKTIEYAKQAYDTILNKKLHRAQKIRALSVYGLACSLAGKRDRAYKIAKTVDSVDLGGSYSLGKPIKKEALAKIYFSLKDYSQAAEISSRFELDPMTYVTKTIAGHSNFYYMVLPLRFIKYKSLLEIGEIDEAKKGYDELLKREEITGVGGIYWQLLFDRGRIHKKERNNFKAISFYKRAIDIIE